MAQTKTVHVEVIADPAHVEALTEFIDNIATAFRRLSTEVQAAATRYERTLEELAEDDPAYD